MRETIAIVGNADTKFFPGLAVALLSALEKASGKYNYQFYVLNGGLEQDQLKWLEEKIKSTGLSLNIEASLTSLHVDETKLQTLPKRRNSRMPFAKLIMPDLLVQHALVIYIDSDILVHRGIEELYESANLSKNWLLYGVRDYFSILKNDCPWLDQLTKEEQNLPYINSGLMAMNLEAFRENKLLDEAIQIRAAAGEQRLGDQSVFNFVCRGKVQLSQAEMNHLIALGSGLLILENHVQMNLHFIGKNKPWLFPPNPSQYVAHQLWHDFADSIGLQRDVTHCALPDDSLIKRHQIKKWTNLFNPKRAAHYRNDLLSLKIKK